MISFAKKNIFQIFPFKWTIKTRLHIVKQIIYFSSPSESRDESQITQNKNFYDLFEKLHDIIKVKHDLI